MIIFIRRGFYLYSLEYCSIVNMLVGLFFYTVSVVCDAYNIYMRIRHISPDSEDILAV